MFYLLSLVVFWYCFKDCCIDTPQAAKCLVVAEDWVYFLKELIGQSLPL